jgi:hypothetical protein
MQRKLSLKKETVVELSADDLSAVAGGAVTIRECIASTAPDCGLPRIPTCGNTCTNTSTVFKG